MFWSSEKTVRMELLSPSVVVTPAAASSASVPERAAATSNLLISAEQFLKLAAVMVAVVNTVLVVLGYMRYVGLRGGLSIPEAIQS